MLNIIFILFFKEHSKFRGLITHGGYNSFLEAANLGAPMIMVPLFSDQAGNRRRAERLGVAIGLDRSDLNVKSQTLVRAIGQILNNET